MKTLFRKTFSFVLSIIFVFSFVTNSFAAKSVNTLKSEMNKRNQAIKETEKEINQKNAQKDQAVEKRNKLDLQIGAMIDDISDTESVINEKQKEIDSKSKEIKEISEKIENNKDTLNERLKIMYEYGATSYVQLILESDGFADLVTRLSIVKSVYQYDKQVINNYVESKVKVENAKKVIQNEQNEQIEAKKILEGKKKNLESLKSEKEQVINSLNSDINELKKQEKQLEADNQALQNEINAALEAQKKASKKSNSSSSQTVTYKGNGKFGWPSAASTKITSPFGTRTHPISGTKSFHRGIDIGAGLGTGVLAAEAGVVITAGWNNSYGYYIAINHGDGYVTLYAHNSSLCVSKGDSVKKGQVIAKCGSTGNSTGPHIHFEVQVNGSLQNPMNFL